MNLENQVCSLELAKRLRALSIRQGSVFFWERTYHDPRKFEVVTHEDLSIDIQRNNFKLPEDLYYSAFTAAELGALLPIQANGGYLRIGKGDNKSNWFAIYEGNFIEDIDEGFLPTVKAVYADSMADALASMLIQLLEGKLITL